MSNPYGRAVRYEASESYARVSFVPCRVRMMLPDVKVVYLLRSAAEVALLTWVHGRNTVEGARREVEREL